MPLPTFIESPRFPDLIAERIRGRPTKRTTVTTLENKAEQRNRVWLNSRWRFDLSSGISNYANLVTVFRYFEARDGRAEGFRFKNILDFKSTNITLGTGTGAPQTFQLFREYSDGVNTPKTKIAKKIVSGTTVLRVNGTPTGSFSVNLNTGILSGTFTNGATLTCDFEFDTPVRFEKDELGIDLEAYANDTVSAVELPEIGVIEIDPVVS